MWCCSFFLTWIIDSIGLFLCVRATWSINVVPTVRTMFMKNEHSSDVGTSWKIEQQLLIWQSELCEGKIIEFILQNTQFDHVNKVLTTRSVLSLCRFLYLSIYLSIRVYLFLQSSLDKLQLGSRAYYSVKIRKT